MFDISCGNFNHHGDNGRYAPGGYRHADLDFGDLAVLSLEETLAVRREIFHA